METMESDLPEVTQLDVPIGNVSKRVRFEDPVDKDESSLRSLVSFMLMVYLTFLFLCLQLLVPFLLLQLLL